MLPKVLGWVGSEEGGLVVQDTGTWTRESWLGEKSTPLPESLIGDAFDRSKTTTASDWCVTPLPRVAEVPGTPSSSARFTSAGISGKRISEPYSPPASAIVLRLAAASDKTGPHAAPPTEILDQVASFLAGALQQLTIQTLQGQRIDQLSGVLNASVDWLRIDNDEELLNAIADAATQLLKCERASIFLWDKRRKKLVGRPALGIKDGFLEVDDNEGIVGEVLETGESRIWSATSDDESRVNRKVDQQLEFETHSLIAVPMINHRDEIIGVFEAINATEKEFNHTDGHLLADLASHSSAAIESLRHRKRLTKDRDRLVADAATASPLIGKHPAINTVRESATKVANTNLSVLILGKNGTGKEVLARMIHYESGRRTGPFVAVNCAALVESLLESELFGHEKGAFTDANQMRQGKFELASGGTLFLDEVGDMSPNGQAKLLRVLEEKVVVRVGGSQTIPVDVRVIAATNQPLEQLIEQKRFREDLFFRLNVVSLTLPPLAGRGTDVMLLANHFMEQFCYQIGRPVPQMSDSARRALLDHAWPGNIRELRNTIERVSYLTSGDMVNEEDLMLTGIGTAGSNGMPLVTAAELTEATKQFQVKHIEKMIETCDGNMTETAHRLGLHRSNLYRKMRQLSMSNSGKPKNRALVRKCLADPHRTSGYWVSFVARWCPLATR